MIYPHNRTLCNIKIIEVLKDAADDIMNLENFMLSEKSQSQKTVKFYLYEMPIIGKFIKTKVD